MTRLTRQNELVALHVALPNEILAEILIAGKPSERSDITRYLLNISAVCTLWRNIALPLPSLWTTITLAHSARGTGVDYLEAMLSRSKDVALDMLLNFERVWHWKVDYARHIKRIVAPHLHRCWSLQLQFTTIHESEAFLPLDPSLMNHLLCFRCHVVDTDGGGPRGLLLFKPSTSPHSFPNLRELRIKGHVSLSGFAATPKKRIDVFEYCGLCGIYEWAYVRRDMPDIMYYIAECCSLTTLVLSVDHGSVFGDQAPVLELPLLTTLKVIDRQASIFHRYISAPRLESLTISPNTSGPDFQSSMMSYKLPFLKTFRSCNHSPTDLTTILEASQSIEKLEIFQCFPPQAIVLALLGHQEYDTVTSPPGYPTAEANLWSDATSNYPQTVFHDETSVARDDGAGQHTVLPALKTLRMVFYGSRPRSDAAWKERITTLLNNRPTLKLVVERLTFAPSRRM